MDSRVKTDAAKKEEQSKLNNFDKIVNSVMREAQDDEKPNYARNMKPDNKIRIKRKQKQIEELLNPALEQEN